MNEEFKSAPQDNMCSIGEVINDRYVVLSLLGQGGMGAVYKVRDLVLEEDLALKILLPHFVTDAAVTERFINEVRITRKIAHPNIVRVHDIGQMGDSLFISMEYVEGESLRTVLDRRGEGSKLSLRQSLYIITQLCIALKYAHHYTIHRDIKPDNIMVTKNDHIKLMDFGIAKLEDARFDTNTDEIVGTPRYMAPEQLHHAPDVDGRADIYSLGVVLHELLTGKLPSAALEPLSRHDDDIPPELDYIIFKCLEQDRAKRFASPVELREALRGLAGSLSDASEPGFTPVREATPGVITPFPTLGNVAGVMESFIQSERFNNDLAGNHGPATDETSVTAAPDPTAYPSLHVQDATPLKDTMEELNPRTVPIAATKQRDSRSRIVAVVAAGLLILGIVIAVYARIEYVAARDQVDTPEPLAEDPQVNVERVQAILDSTDNLPDALAVALEEYKRVSSIENIKTADAIRQMFIEDVKERIYANPFSMDKLNLASKEVVQVGHFDSNTSIRELTRLVNHEVALFKFVLVAIDSGRRLATFRLNNAYSPKETVQVKVGDLFQERFRIVGMGIRSVYLEDTNPKCANRSLVARLMEPVVAE